MGLASSGFSKPVRHIAALDHGLSTNDGPATTCGPGLTSSADARSALCLRESIRSTLVHSLSCRIPPDLSSIPVVGNRSRVQACHLFSTGSLPAVHRACNDRNRYRPILVFTVNSRDVRFFLLLGIFEFHSRGSDWDVFFLDCHAERAS